MNIHEHIIYTHNYMHIDIDVHIHRHPHKHIDIHRHRTLADSTKLGIRPPELNVRHGKVYLTETEV